MKYCFKLTTLPDSLIFLESTYSKSLIMTRFLRNTEKYPILLAKFYKQLVLPLCIIYSNHYKLLENRLIKMKL